MEKLSKQNKTRRPLEIRYSGPELLEMSLLNKGNAFSAEERRVFDIEGLLPLAIESIEEQSSRAYQQFSSFREDLEKHVFLRNIQDTNETLYFKLITDHLEEMMPIIYTPTVGLACQKFSQIYRCKRGLFIAYPDRERINQMIQSATKDNVKVIVVTDSERILGLGDQGIGGMGIPIGKLALYSACGGISPAYTLPVTLDVGTNNQALLDDPLYMGWRHKRIVGQEYSEFVDQFLQGLQRRWPNALIQFEDFAQTNATPLLTKYRDQFCCFNDDIQGTAAVTVGTLLAACHVLKTSLKDHRIVFVGAGSAGCGIAQQILMHMQKEGLSEAQALDQVFLVDSRGLLTDDQSLRDFQKKFVKPKSCYEGWSSDGEQISLLDSVREIKPTIIIGVSGVAGLMSESVIKTMVGACSNPIVLPLSNPTSQVEAQPKDVIEWTEGNAIVATGSPFEAVKYQENSYSIAQCNNSYIFPGIGLGVIASGANRVTETMFMVASETLAACSPLVNGSGDTLLPELSEISTVSRMIALQIGLQAMEEGVAPMIAKEALESAIDENFWAPEYREYKRI